MLGLFKRFTFGHLVLCNSFRNPALLAKMVANLCYLAPQRFILGIGAGWNKSEYLGYGYEFLGALARIEALEEGVEIIRKMWTEKVVHYQGRYFNINGADRNPKPYPVPPILIGGSGEKQMFRIIASQADWWCNEPRLTVEEYAHKLEVLKYHCEKVGRSYEAIKKVWYSYIAIAKTEDEALRIADNNPFVAKDASGVFRRSTILGNPIQVKNKIDEIIDLGVEYFILRFLDFPNTAGAELFVEKVADELD